MQQLTRVFNPNKLIFAGVLLVIIILIGIALKPYTVIDSGNRGLKFTMGKLDEQILNEGVNWKMPLFQKIEPVSIQTLQIDHVVPVGPDGAITKDNQTIGAGLTLFYRYKTDQLVDLWRNVGVDKINIIAKSAMTEAFKQDIGKYTIFDIAPVQEDIRNSVFERLKATLAKYPIELTELRVNNYDWPDSFEAQIDETMKKAQKVKQAAQDLLATEQEAQKQVKLAEAEKTTLITIAEGKKAAEALMADAKALQGEGIKRYNDFIRQTIDIEIQLRELEIKKITAEKWNGINVPTQAYYPIPISNGSITGMVNQPRAEQ